MSVLKFSFDAAINRPNCGRLIITSERASACMLTNHGSVSCTVGGSNAITVGTVSPLIDAMSMKPASFNLPSTLSTSSSFSLASVSWSFCPRSATSLWCLMNSNISFTIVSIRLFRPHSKIRDKPSSICLMLVNSSCGKIMVTFKSTSPFF